MEWGGPPSRGDCPQCKGPAFNAETQRRRGAEREIKREYGKSNPCLRLLPIEGQVENRGGVSEGADADAVDAGVGDGADSLQIDAAGGFELGGRAGGVADLDGLAKLNGRHVVEQDDVGVFRQDFAELIERIDFDFDHRMWVGRSRWRK